jgi:hypothetical protein
VPGRYQFALPDPRSRDGWFRVGNLDITTTAMLVIAGVASMFVYAASTTLFGKLMFHPVLVRDGELWRLFTWPIANAPNRIWVVLTLLFFWIFGHAVEELVSRRRFTVLMVAITIMPAVLVTVLPFGVTSTAPEVGLGLLGTVVLVVLAAEHPHMPFFFGIPAWIVAAVFVGIDVLRLVGDRYWGTLTLMLSAIALALVIVRQWGFATQLQFIPQFTSNTSRSPRRGPAPRRQKRSSGRVVEGPWAAPSSPPSPARAAADQAELDELLDKISASGLDALTADEKRRLNELSKRLR